MNNDEQNWFQQASPLWGGGGHSICALPGQLQKPNVLATFLLHLLQYLLFKSIAILL